MNNILESVSESDSIARKLNSNSLLLEKGFKSKSMYFNKLSSLPMFESGSVASKSFYNTTYRDEYNERRNNKLRDISNRDRYKMRNKIE
jgi:hypothetical protein